MQIINNYRVEIEEAVEQLRRMNVSRVLVQSPLGLRGVAASVAEQLKSNKFEVLMSSSNCWGGCDIAYTEASGLDVDAIIHLGHSRFLRHDKLPTIYLECRYADPSPVYDLMDRIAAELTGYKKVGVGASVQWLDYLSFVKESLARRGVDAVTAMPDMYSVYESQVLGCDVSALKKLEKNVDCFLVLGSVFHGLGIAVSGSKPVYAADPHTQRVENLDKMRERILRQRYAQIIRFRESSTVGVLVSIKPGQKRLGLAKKLNNMLNQHGKNSTIVSADEITSATILENGFEAFVNTACPRLSIEDQSRFTKPVLLPVEALVAVGLMEWETVVEHGFLMYPWGWHDRKVGERFWRGVSLLQV
uniref:2-(3-amino-3-carboxypropyl)histidine synthase n=1 Tax=Caldiarchaeum subterraneum TaxID=311458 RepID=E6NA86_CALS0|nr:diphthamide synthase subunit DPH2 [Candidatus Caldarchaeum subterraneum]